MLWFILTKIDLMCTYDTDLNTSYVMVHQSLL